MVDIYDQFKDFKSFEVTFYNDLNELQKLFCNVKSIENSSIIIEADKAQNKNIAAKVGAELKLYIYTENGIYSATSRVLLVTEEAKSTEYVISYPANSKHSQRREYFRADLNVDFEIQASPTSDPDSTVIINASTRNMCGKGMSYLADKPFPQSDSIIVNLLFSEKTVSTQANIVYSKQIVVGSKPKFIHAFTFINISQKDIDFIVKKCFLHQLDLRKKQKINQV